MCRSDGRSCGKFVMVLVVCARHDKWSSVFEVDSRAGLYEIIYSGLVTWSRGCTYVCGVVIVGSMSHLGGVRA